jgi:protein-S-isoprenylcysteine O-methyltransferase Ste14
MMGRFLILLYGGLSYLIFLGVFLYAIGFVGDLVVPKSLDSAPQSNESAAVLMDVLLLGLFAVPHSIMARPGFKAWWTRIVPRPAERSTYVLVSSLLLALVFWQWQPLSAVVWEIVHPAGRLPLYAVFWGGWVIVLWSTFLIDHFDLCGLRQVYLHANGRPYEPMVFRTPMLYRFVRHPIMLGFLIAFWATPRMTAGHLLFAAANTAYILVAVRLEERDLEVLHGESYRDYRRRVGMLWPIGLFKRN